MPYKQLGRDPVEAALNAMERFDKFFRSSCQKSGADGLVRRLKEFPQLLLQTGLTPALTFFLSKLDENKKRTAYTVTLQAVLSDGSVSVGDREKNSFCGTISGEGGGYPHALALIMAYLAERLEEAGVSDAREKVESITSSFIEALEKIREQGAVLERLVLAYATELKKLASALYGS